MASLRTNRREFLLSSLSLGLVAATARAGVPTAGLSLGSPVAFEFEALRQRAQRAAGEAFVDTPAPAADIVHALSFDAMQNIKFRPEFTLWRRGPGAFPVRFFHLNQYVDRPVRIHAVTDHQSREVLYQASYFDYGDAALAARLPQNLGFAGFRLMSGHTSETDWLAFQGASYFRSAGSDNQYGLSARALAVNTALSTHEEFPRFTEFWLEPSNDGSPTMTIYAFLNSQSVTGAFQFLARKDTSVTMLVDASLYLRENVERLGIAPLTSMYWYRAGELRAPVDWRPGIHDSDGLALYTGAGERLWRPLNNPQALQTNSFQDVHPRGFGLSQRDREFEHYEDDGAFYNRRPSLWVEPEGDWGEGAVQLVEIPTDDEVHDNIVAYWQSRAAVTRGEALRYRYRLRWQSADPLPGAGIGRVVATRLGAGGVPGRERPKDQYKFVIDFEGELLRQMKSRFDIEPVVEASRGRVLNPYSLKVVDTSYWRGVFDLAVTGKEPVNLRCFLRLGKQTLSETWIYQFFPPE
jgi:glucans biosynthesis protein